MYGEHERLVKAGEFCGRDCPLLALVDKHGGISINAADVFGSECRCLQSKKVILLWLDAARLSAVLTYNIIYYAL